MQNWRAEGGARGGRGPRGGRVEGGERGGGGGPRPMRRPERNKRQGSRPSEGGFMASAASWLRSTFSISVALGIGLILGFFLCLGLTVVFGGLSVRSLNTVSTMIASAVIGLALRNALRDFRGKKE